MSSKDEQITRAEIWISHILRWGVFTCAGVIAIGWISHSVQIINGGLLMLIFLPIARVFAAGIIFLKQKDFIYVGFSAFVLLVLIASLLLGKEL
jgi:uncharacterized membrane protein